MPAEESLIGREIGGYVVTEIIGQGGMATVHRAVQQSDLSAVAIKVLHRQYLVDPTFARRFGREVEAARRLSHPSTVRVLDHGVVDGRPYLVMELLAGEDLFERLRRVHRLSEREAVLVTIAICDALEAAHGLGIVHRDLKPENVMLLGPPDDGAASVAHLKVLDFGIAKVREPDAVAATGSSGASGSSLTAVGAIIGTPEFLSPEQARGNRVDGRADLYACAIVLYRMLTGRVPFPDEGNAFATALKHTTHAPPDPSTLVPSIHPELEVVILHTLAKKPADRPASAAELRAALQAMLPALSTERLALAPGVPEPRPPVPRAPVDPTQGRPAGTLASAAQAPPPPPPPPPEVVVPAVAVPSAAEAPRLDRTLPQGSGVVQLPSQLPSTVNGSERIRVVEAPPETRSSAIEARLRSSFLRGLGVGFALGLLLAVLVMLAR